MVSVRFIKWLKSWVESFLKAFLYFVELFCNCALVLFNLDCRTIKSNTFAKLSCSCTGFFRWSIVLSFKGWVECILFKRKGLVFKNVWAILIWYFSVWSSCRSIREAEVFMRIRLYHWAGVNCRHIYLSDFTKINDGCFSSWCWEMWDTTATFNVCSITPSNSSISWLGLPESVILVVVFGRYCVAELVEVVADAFGALGHSFECGRRLEAFRTRELQKMATVWNPIAWVWRERPSGPLFGFHRARWADSLTLSIHVAVFAAFFAEILLSIVPIFLELNFCLTEHIFHHVVLLFKFLIFWIIFDPLDCLFFEQWPVVLVVWVTEMLRAQAVVAEWKLVRIIIVVMLCAIFFGSSRRNLSPASASYGICLRFFHIIFELILKVQYHILLLNTLLLKLFEDIHELRLRISILTGFLVVLHSQVIVFCFLMVLNISIWAWSVVIVLDSFRGITIFMILCF